MQQVTLSACQNSSSQPASNMLHHWLAAPCFCADLSAGTVVEQLLQLSNSIVASAGVPSTQLTDITPATLAAVANAIAALNAVIATSTDVTQIQKVWFEEEQQVEITFRLSLLGAGDATARDGMHAAGYGIDGNNGEI